jgi:hypothetical protein
MDDCKRHRLRCNHPPPVVVSIARVDHDARDGVSRVNPLGDWRKHRCARMYRVVNSSYSHAPPDRVRNFQHTMSADAISACQCRVSCSVDITYAQPTVITNACPSRPSSCCARSKVNGGVESKHVVPQIHLLPRAERSVVVEALQIVHCTARVDPARLQRAAIALRCRCLHDGVNDRWVRMHV